MTEDIEIYKKLLGEKLADLHIANDQIIALEHEYTETKLKHIILKMQETELKRQILAKNVEIAELNKKLSVRK
jgi:hypothetical protein